MTNFYYEELIFNSGLNISDRINAAAKKRRTIVQGSTCDFIPSATMSRRGIKGLGFLL